MLGRKTKLLENFTSVWRTFLDACDPRQHSALRQQEHAGGAMRSKTSRMYGRETDATVYIQTIN